jgi:hypothetical protein
MAVQPMLSGDEPVEHEGFLTAELGEQENRCADKPEIADRLKVLHATWRQEVGLDQA